MVACMLVLAASGCADTDTGAPSDDAPVAGDASAEGTVLVLGTSLTAGLGVGLEQAYPALLQEKIDSAGLPFQVVNAGVSGETSAGARRRLEWLLRQPFDVLVLETGANDMLRGSDPDATRANLVAVVERVREARPGTRIVLAGMRAHPNLGRSYVRSFESIYPEVAREDSLVLVPFLLEGVAGRPSLNQGDGLHPNAAGQRHIAATVWGTLEPVLRDAANSRASR